MNKLKVILFCCLVVLSCQTLDEERLSVLLPETINSTLEREIRVGIPAWCNIYSLDGQVDVVELKNYPREGDLSNIRKWHKLNSEEKENIVNMLNNTLKPNGKQVNEYTEQVSELIEEINNNNGYCCYYYRDSENIGYYKEGFADLYYLLPNENKIILVSYWDM